jgi:hypothetical protein
MLQHVVTADQAESNGSQAGSLELGLEYFFYHHDDRINLYVLSSTQIMNTYKKRRKKYFLLSTLARRSGIWISIINWSIFTILQPFSLLVKLKYPVAYSKIHFFSLFQSISVYFSYTLVG